MRTMHQQLACYFRCTRRTLPSFIELIRGSLVRKDKATPKDGQCMTGFGQQVHVILI
jgi:hypothetical protein